MAERYATVDDLPPEFDSVTLSTRQYWLDHSEVYLSVCVFGTAASQAHAMLAAHFIARSPARSEMSPPPLLTVSSRTVGPVSTGIAAPALSSHLGMTSYGLAYQDMQVNVFAGPVVA